MKGRSCRVLSSTIAMSAFALSLPLQAQTPDEGGAAEIIVTAQRREQSVIDVPLSIQAFSDEQLASSGIDDMTSLQFATPGYFPDNNNGFVQVYIRGIGNAVFVGADPSVATFIDDVPQIYGAMIDNFPDLERVEVLKGAQGGLYGRNATGGVVNIITRAPDPDALGARFTGSFGERDSVRVSGYLNVPLSDSSAWSVSIQRETHDPYIDNIASPVPYSAANFPNGAVLPVPNGTTPISSPFGNLYVYTPSQAAAYFSSPQDVRGQDRRDFWAARSKLLLGLTDDLQLTLTGSYANKSDNSSGQFVSSTPEFNQAALVGLFGLIGVTADLPPGFIPGSGGRKWTTSIGINPAVDIEEYGFSGKLDWAIPGMDISSITAYRNMKQFGAGDAATSAVPFIPFTSAIDRDYFYQELRFVSDVEGPLSYLGGATYLKNNVALHSRLFFFTFQAPFAATKVDQDIKNWSVYGEVGYQVTDALNVRVSGRYMSEKNVARFTLPIVDGTESKQSKFVPSVTVSYDIAGGGNIYARWARGFKTGGVNLFTAPVNFPRPSDGAIFGPETVDTFEAGFKAALLGRRLLVSAAAFYNRYKDLQVDVRGRPEFPNIVLALVNAESARTWGVEGGLTWRVSDPLTINVHGGYLNAKYKDFQLTGSEVLVDFDLSGRRMPKAPEWQASFQADFDQPVADNLRLVASALASYTDDVIFKYSPLPGIQPPATGSDYWLVNARLGLKTMDDHLGLFLVADNLFDTVYYVGADSGSFGNLLNYGQRRVIRGELTFNF